jgi:hypothetical protein
VDKAYEIEIGDSAIGVELIAIAADERNEDILANNTKNPLYLPSDLRRFQPSHCPIV